MPQNFLECDREQVFLMPPDPRDWLPEGHWAWFVLASVEQMDLSAFLAAYRLDGWGRGAVEPSMMVSLLLYAYARGERSARGIEGKCVEDVAYRVIAAHQKPDHATIARFRARHEEALAELFSEVLCLCKQAGLLKVGVIAIDGTKVHANASHHCNLDYEQLAREFLEEAGEIDAAEDELCGDARGDELPEHLRASEVRRLLCERQSASSNATAPRTRARRARRLGRRATWSMPCCWREGALVRLLGRTGSQRLGSMS
jgi:transposase